jgi:elongation factor 1-gamma
MEMVDNEGYAFWFLHYEKVGKEGQVDYVFTNLLEGFIQRLDGFRKHAFGKICMLGEMPSLEIAGVLLIRGQVIPQECIDHPQFEYMRPRKMDMKNQADNDLARDFFSSKDYTGQAMGFPVQISMWHK